MTEPQSPDADEPKIIVDDDYKQRVEQEKEQLRQKMDESAGSAEDSDIPPASMPMLINSLAMQALANLGQIPDPIEGRPVIRKPMARHFIDTLAMLEEKTSGNLEPDEKAMLEEVVHQLRMAFVAVPDTAPAGPESDPGAGSSLELP